VQCKTLPSIHARIVVVPASVLQPDSSAMIGAVINDRFWYSWLCVIYLEIECTDTDQDQEIESVWIAIFPK